MSIDINNILINLKKVQEANISYIQKIINIQDKSLQIKEFENFSKISSNIHNLNTLLEEMYFTIMDNSENNISAEDKIKIKDIRLNNKVQEIMLPYYIYMKILLENNMQ